MNFWNRIPDGDLILYFASFGVVITALIFQLMG